MKERNLDFDRVIERRGTGSLKFDCAKKRGYSEDVTPMWVADMDFMTSGFVLDAVTDRVNHGIFGYSEPSESYFDAVYSWLNSRHGWRTDESWLVKTPGVVFALATAVKAYTSEGDAVLIQQPVYYPFFEVISDNKRRVISSDLVKTGDGGYAIDFYDFENKIKRDKVKLFLLCSPHNPVGRVWSREELAKIGDICLKYGVIVVSDEIHSDLVFYGRHSVFASVDERFKDISVTCTSPAKTFNLAGLQVSNIFIPNEKLREAFIREVSAAGYSQLNTLGLVACEAAYRYGGEWYEAMMEYVRGNIVFTAKFLSRNLPQIALTPPQGTYLLWLDFSSLCLTERQRRDLIANKAGLWLDSGIIFGKSGEGYERMNVACPAKTLEYALTKLKTAIDNI